MKRSKRPKDPSWIVDMCAGFGVSGSLIYAGYQGLLLAQRPTKNIDPSIVWVIQLFAMAFLAGGFFYLQRVAIFYGWQQTDWLVQKLGAKRPTSKKYLRICFLTLFLLLASLATMIFFVIVLSGPDLTELIVEGD